MTKIYALAAAAWLAGHCLSSVARAEGARVEVATLDGAPVYHWRPFDSKLSDDVDRALVLREFERRGFKLPGRLVDEGVRAAMEKEAGGDEAKFVEQLRRRGATLADYRQYVAEEITVAAMFYQKAPDEAARTHWLADLRANARVKRLHVAPSASK